MGIDDLIRPKREPIRRIAERHGARNARVFGSVARGEAGPQSDVDFLIEVVTERGLVPELRDRVLREAVPV